MADPFIDVSVYPHYGRSEAVVTWNMAPGFVGSPCHVYRSYNETSWDLLNEDPVTDGEYLDTDLVIRNRVQRPMYRVFCSAGPGYDSPVITPFDKLSPREYAVAHAIIHKEYRRMSYGNGIRVLHYKPLTSGTRNPNFDPDTYQELGPTCPDNPEDDSFGMPFVGGYGPPVQTWTELLSLGQFTEDDTPDGGGRMDGFQVTRARMLAYPRPRTGDLIVHPPTDDRYVVGPQVQPHRFRGIVAVAYDTTLALLRRNDPRYRVPVPSMLDDPDPTRTNRPQHA